MIVCSCCRVSKEPELFPTKRAALNGRGSWCRACVRLAAMRRYFKLARAKALARADDLWAKIQDIESKIGRAARFARRRQRDQP